MLKELFEVCGECTTQCCTNRPVEYQTVVYPHEVREAFFGGARLRDNGYGERTLLYENGTCHLWKDGRCSNHDVWRSAVCKAYPFFEVPGRFIVNKKCPISKKVAVLNSTDRSLLIEELSEYYDTTFSAESRACLAKIGPEYEEKQYI